MEAEGWEFWSQRLPGPLVGEWHHACIGAATDHYWQGQQLGAGLDSRVDPQRNHVAGTDGGPADIVTLTMGGNDLDFADVITGCLVTDCSKLELDGLDWDGLFDNLVAMYSHIRDNMDAGGHLFVLSYPELFADPETWEGGRAGTCEMGISADEADLLNLGSRRIGDTVFRAVHEVDAVFGNVHFVDVRPAFRNRGLCRAGIESYIRGIGLDPRDPLTESFHPSSSGYTAMAGVLTDCMRTVIADGGRCDAGVAAGGRVCFGVAGDVGDVAVVNVTPVEARGAGNGLLVSSDVSNPPVAANVNYRPGSVDPNVAIAPIGSDGEVCFVNAQRAGVHLVADHLGTIAAESYRPADPSGAPRRTLDTREVGGVLAPSERRCFEVEGDVGDVAVVNLTPVEARGAGNGLLVSSDVSNPPVAANVNYRPGSVDPNVAIAPIGSDGEVCFVNAQRAGVHLVADHLGTIAAESYRPADPSGAPRRTLDTREVGGVLAPSERRCFEVEGDVGDVAVVNVTPVEARGAGNGLLVSSDVSNPPVAANVNYRPGSVDPNVAIAPIGSDGEVCFVNAQRAGVHLVADHLGTIAAESYRPADPSGAPRRTLDTRDEG